LSLQTIAMTRSARDGGRDVVEFEVAHRFCGAQVDAGLVHAAFDHAEEMSPIAPDSPTCFAEVPRHHRERRANLASEPGVEASDAFNQGSHHPHQVERDFESDKGRVGVLVLVHTRPHAHGM
jgi:hypothetical protein